MAAPVAAEDALYQTHIQPVLKERCYACHGGLKQEAGLRVDTGALLRKGGASGSVIDLTDADKSQLLERLTATEDGYRMPPDGKPLSVEEVDAFRRWISAGAVSPDNEKPEPDPSQHWAFQKPERPLVPEIADDNWSQNAVDRLIHQQHVNAGLQHAADASPEHRLRRVYLDLTGLPPTIEQVEKFVADPSPAHYLQVVDELLNSPQYGERWARHWMDIWRYSDWYGRRQQNDVRNSAAQIWRWREWIVDSLNADKSYARMIQEMLAADEVAATDDSAWPATGYLIRNYYSLNPNEWMRHNVEYTGKAFLGLTFNCAHCHDHKYDPISHDDYFRMRAFFEPIGIRQDRVVGGPEPPPFEVYKYGGSRKVVREGMVRVYDETPDAPTWFYTGGDERNRVEDRGSIAPGVPGFINVPFPEISAIDLPLEGWYPGSRSALQQALIAEHAAEVDAAQAALEAAQQPTDNSRELAAQVTAAEAEFQAALQQAVAAGEQGALAGQQSLLLDGGSGRRILQHEVLPLKEMVEGAVVQFTLSILNDGHFNFQLAKDSSKHLTALYVGFRNGQIKAYQPGGFVEFVAGTYSVGQPQVMQVTLVLQPADDVARLRIAAVPDAADASLIADVDIALNGWNPTLHAHQPFTLDCHAGTRVLVDDVQAEFGSQSWSWNFEAPEYSDGRDVAGVQGWTAHPQSSGSSLSLVSSVGGCQSAAPAHTKLLAAKEALRAGSQVLQNAKLRHAAAVQNAASLQATIAADNAVRDGAPAETIQQLSQQAVAAQRQARLLDAEWQVANSRQQLDQLRGLPEADQKRAEKIQAAEKQFTAAEQTWKTVQEQLASATESTEYQRLSRVTSAQSTGRRAALAKWITHPDNPLTPRVAVNHIWMRHFREPLVGSVFDFGRNGKQPTHPELLDWLAVVLVQHDWSMKHIHRLIVTSRTYQMTSSARGLEASAAIDEENRFLWRMNSRRMEAEAVRDSLLAIAGLLDQKVGGEVLPNTEALTTYRRSLYYEVYPESGGNNALAEVFDAPDPGDCFRRTSTVVPQQALALSNSQLVHTAAKATSDLIIEIVADNNPQFVQQAFQRILARQPEPREQAVAERFLQQQQDSQSGFAQAARESLVRVLFNHNDFITVR